jgi:uncharacterized membrane protein YfcA
MEHLSVIQQALAVLSGTVVGVSLGLIGGGGSILAVPLLLYLVGYRDPHVVIGTTALAVAANAYLNLIPHARAGHVRWASAAVFAVAGAAAAIAGSALGKAVNGQRLLLAFAILMLVVAALMLRPLPARAGAAARLGWPAAGRLAAAGVAAGFLAGFFGIGGGFLIVPGLVLATGMPMIEAIGSSLVSVGTFGLTTAASYALSGLVDWRVAAEFIAGGILGGWLGERLASRLEARKRALRVLYSAVIAAVAAYMLYRTAAT